jgi:hypothetical protein
MKFVTLRTKRLHPQNKLDKPPNATVEDFVNPRVTFQRIHTYTELRQQIHNDLRIQHPDWIQPGGESPMCDYYEARLMELLGIDAKGLRSFR